MLNINVTEAKTACAAKNIMQVCIFGKIIVRFTVQDFIIHNETKIFHTDII